MKRLILVDDRGRRLLLPASYVFKWHQAPLGVSLSAGAEAQVPMSELASVELVDDGKD